MKTNLIVIGACLGAALLGTLLLDQWMQPKAIPITTDETADLSRPAPPVTLTDQGGKTHTLADFKGRGVILNFWASWCAPCRTEMPQLFDLAKRHAGDLTLILISVDADKAAMTRFFTETKLTPRANILIVHDPMKTVSKDVFGTVRYPESILIDRQGMMRRKIAGGVDWTQVDLAPILAP